MRRANNARGTLPACWRSTNPVDKPKECAALVSVDFRWSETLFTLNRVASFELLASFEVVKVTTTVATIGITGSAVMISALALRRF